MSTDTTDILSTRRCDMAFCPGCSHGALLDSLATAMSRLNLPPERICIVSDIGCVGLADRYFTCHTFHGLHGRSLTYAEGILRARPDMLVVVLIGDGGCGIGTAHLVHAARRGAPVKVIVFNNFNFGMTGGQGSPTTPPGAFTSTTTGGAAERPMDICQTVMANGAAHVARCSALDRDCTDRIEAALRSPGFALVDIWELCMAYFVERNRLKPAGLGELACELNMPFGLLRDELPILREPPAPPSARGLQKPPAALDSPLRWQGRGEIWLAGSAGQHIRTAAGIIGNIAVAGGLFVSQEDDFPITVRRGHSVSQLVIDESPIRYTGCDDPDIVVVLSGEGLKRVGALASVRSDACILLCDELTRPAECRVCEFFDMAALKKSVGAANVALAALALGLFRRGLFDPHVLCRAADIVINGRHRDQQLAALRHAAGIHALRHSRTITPEDKP